MNKLNTTKVKYFLFFIFLNLTLSVWADHMSFMGIPINGPISTFQTGLINKGFKFLQKDEDGRMYKGKFYGESVELYVSYDQKIKSVYSVLVIFPEMHLTTARAFYDRLFSSMSEKYKFDQEDKHTQYALGGNELRSSYFKYINQQEEIIGIIELSEDSKYNDYWCTLGYYDLDNLNKRTKSKNDDL